LAATAQALDIVVNRLKLQVPSRWAYEQLGIPQPTDEEDVLEGAPQPQPFNGFQPGDREDFDCDGFGNQTLEMQERVSPEYVANLRQLWKNRDGILVIKRGDFNE